MKTFHIISIKVIRKFFFIFLNIKLFNYWCQDGYINLNNDIKKKNSIGKSYNGISCQYVDRTKYVYVTSSIETFFIVFMKYGKNIN